ncbi:hypothetical protein [Actinomadura madurae]|uniref:Uncharacterized protein n=1 Tax=Actinomadura madurae TaxID=1993 RepID=A0A1I5G9D5_9ACTN|nr:hypothetical protein [Actinomadura madurae]SFO32617.1 hypothetical protein SAMN04489713_10595 [Actinomadura madurae]SPT51056.1 Uncharacterised protein [Actinomadura madurae]
MSTDLVALVRRRPDVHAIADGMIAMGEPLELRGGEPDSTRLHDGEGRLLVSIEDAVQVSVQGEIGRLLGAEFAARVMTPVWWVDVRAVADVPEAQRVARKFADSLVHWLGGMVYPEGAADAPARSWRASGQGGPGAEGGTAGGTPGGFPGPAGDPGGAAYQGGVIGG